MTINQLKLKIKILKIQLKILFLRKKLTVPNLPVPKHIDLHHGGGDWDFIQVDNHHRRLWGFKSSLGYHSGYQYFIEFSGQLYQARADNERGAHMVEASRPRYWNNNSIGICLQGNLDIIKPTKEQLVTLEKLLDRIRLKYGIGKYNIYGHRDYVNTLCPGRSLHNWLMRYKQT